MTQAVLCWRRLTDFDGDPSTHMMWDAKMAREVREGQSPPTLRIYTWATAAISLGRHQSETDLPEGLTRKGRPVVIRPTGGGAVEHSPEELTYAVALPRKMLPAGLRLNRIAERLHAQFRNLLVEGGLFSAQALALVRADFPGPAALCFSAPVRGDLMYQGKKAAGSALRIWRDGVLIQGTIQGLPVCRERLLEPLTAAVERSFPA